MIFLIWLSAGLAVIIWPFVVAINFDLSGSDAAGNAITDGMAALGVIIVWSLLGVSLLLAARRRLIPGWSLMMALLLMPLSAAAAINVTDLLSQDIAVKWMLAIQIAVPPAVVLYLAWGTYPALHRAVPERIATAILWGGVLVLSVLPWPQVMEMPAIKEQRYAAWQAHEQELNDRFSQLQKQASLQAWLHFLDTAEDRRQDVLEQIHGFANRQAEIEKMLAAGDGTGFTALSELDLALTPSLCGTARQYLQQIIPGFKPASATAHFADIRDSVEPYLGTLYWLSGNQCDIRPELDALEKVLRLYPDGEQEAALLLSTLDDIHKGLDK